VLPPTRQSGRGRGAGRTGRAGMSASRCRVSPLVTDRHPRAGSARQTAPAGRLPTTPAGAAVDRTHGRSDRRHARRGTVTAAPPSHLAGRRLAGAGHQDSSVPAHRPPSRGHPVPFHTGKDARGARNGHRDADGFRDAAGQPAARRHRHPRRHQRVAGSTAGCSRRPARRAPAARSSRSSACAPHQTSGYAGTVPRAGHQQRACMPTSRVVGRPGVMPV